MEDAPAAETVVEGDVIERVLWHQPLGRSEQQRAAGESVFPSEMEWGGVMKGGSGVEWEEQEIYVKWMGRSYLHCEWLPLAELGTVSRSVSHSHVVSLVSGCRATCTMQAAPQVLKAGQISTLRAVSGWQRLSWEPIRFLFCFPP